MKWDKPIGSTQHTADKRYCIVQANSEQWVAYKLHGTGGKDLGTKNTDEAARLVCEDHERALITARQIA